MPEDVVGRLALGVGAGRPEGFLDLSCYEDDEGESLAHIVVGETQGLEIIPVLDKIKIALDTPSFLVEAEDSLCSFLCKRGLEDEYPEGALQQFKPLGSVFLGCADPLGECLLFLSSS